MNPRGDWGGGLTTQGLTPRTPGGKGGEGRKSPKTPAEDKRPSPPKTEQKAPGREAARSPEAPDSPPSEAGSPDAADPDRDYQSSAEESEGEESEEEATPPRRAGASVGASPAKSPRSSGGGRLSTPTRLPPKAKAGLLQLTREAATFTPSPAKAHGGGTTKARRRTGDSEQYRGKHLSTVVLTSLPVLKKDDGQRDLEEWMRAAQEALKYQQRSGIVISGENAISLIMARVEPGTSVAYWFGSLQEEAGGICTKSFEAFHEAFLDRYGSTMQTAEVLRQMGSISITSYGSLGDYYDGFLGLHARIRSVRTHDGQPIRSDYDIHQAFINGFPQRIVKHLKLVMYGPNDGVVWSLQTIFREAKRFVEMDGDGDVGRGEWGAVGGSLAATPVRGQGTGRPTPQAQAFFAHAGGGGPADAAGCYNCGAQGHIKRDCPVAMVAGAGPGGGCFHCGRAGHIKRDCPVIICRRCNRPGHMERTCEAGGGPQRGQPPMQQRAAPGWHQWGAAMAPPASGWGQGRPQRP